MATSKRQDEAGDAPKTTRRRTATPSATSEPNATRPAESSSATTPSSHASATHDTTRGVTEAKPPASTRASLPAPEFGATLPVTETPRYADDEIRRRAYELYEQDGQQHGRDRDHWLRAEAEILGRAREGRSTEDQAREARAERTTRRTQKSA